MKERPILFNTEMVQAILAGRKTQTRRALKHQPQMSDILPNLVFPKNAAQARAFNPAGWIYPNALDQILAMCPFGAVGDRIWVRESFRLFDASDECCCSDFPCGCPRSGTPVFRATHDDGDSKWKPSLHMPRTACRIILEITGLRVERLHDITNADCKAEGYPADREADGGSMDPFLWFRDLWNKTGGNFNSKPWVWVVEFKVLTTNGVIREAA